MVTAARLSDESVFFHPGEPAMCVDLKTSNVTASPLTCPGGGQLRLEQNYDCHSFDLSRGCGSQAPQFEWMYQR